MTDRPPETVERPPEAWERLPGETEKAFAAFDIYRSLGTSRTQEATRTRLGRPSGYSRVLEEWSSRWGWVERARAWDDHLTRKELAEQERNELRDRARARRARIGAGMKILKLGVEALSEEKAQASGFRDLAAAVSKAVDVLRVEFEGETRHVEVDVRAAVEDTWERREDLRAKRLAELAALVDEEGDA